MKCINMKIAEIIFFLVNFVIIRTSVVRPNKETHNGYEVSGETSKSKFEENCSHLWKIMTEHNLIDYIRQCKEPVVKEQITKDDVLLHSCFVIQNMISVACNSKINETSLDLLGRDKLNNICPFNFSHLEQFESVFKNHEIVKELTGKDNCDAVCYDVYTTEVPCILLDKFNNYLRTQMTAAQPKVNISMGHPPSSNLPSHNYDRTAEGQTSQEKITLGQSKPVEDSSKVGVKSPVGQLSEPVEHLTKFSKKENRTEKPVNVPTQKDLKLSKKAGQIPMEEQKSNRKPELLPEETKTSNKEEQILSEKPKSDKKSTEKLKSSEKAEQITLEEPKLSDTEQQIPSEQPSSKPEFTNVDMAVPEDDDLNSWHDDVGADTSNEGIPQDEISLDRTSSNQDLQMQKKQEFLEKEGSSLTEKESYIGEGFTQAEDSHFFFYFIMVSSVIVVGYLAFHNKNKILAYALEGSNGRRSRRRPNPARYRKLETNLEEAMSSGATNAATSSVVY